MSLLLRLQTEAGLQQPLQWDAEADAIKILAKMKEEKKKVKATDAAAEAAKGPLSESASSLLDIRVLLQYVSSLVTCLTAACRSSAILKDSISSELLKSGRISIRLVDCIASLAGRKAIVDGGEIAILQQEEGGEVEVVTTLKAWGKQVTRLEQVDLDALFDDPEEAE
jgi:hypothetical protein